MRIGAFTLDNDGVLRGRIFGLGLGSVPVVFDPQTSNGGKEYFRLIADPTKDAYEVGVAFPKTKGEMAYHSVSIESPALAAPINAALFADKEQTGSYSLVWNRPEPQGLKAEATVSVGGKPQQARRFASPKVN